MCLAPNLQAFSASQVAEAQRGDALEALEQQYEDTFVVYPVSDLEALQHLYEKTSLPTRDLTDLQSQLQAGFHLPLDVSEGEVAAALCTRSLKVVQEAAQTDGAAGLPSWYHAPGSWFDDSDASTEVYVDRNDARRRCKKARSGRGSSSSFSSSESSHGSTAAATDEIVGQQQQAPQRHASAHDHDRLSSHPMALGGEQASSSGEEAAAARDASELEWAAFWRRSRARPAVEARDLDTTYELEFDVGLDPHFEGEELVLRGARLPDAAQRSRLLAALEVELDRGPRHVRRDIDKQHAILRTLGEALCFGSIHERLRLPFDADLARSTRLTVHGARTVITIPKATPTGGFMNSNAHNFSSPPQQYRPLETHGLMSDGLW